MYEAPDVEMKKRVNLGLRAVFAVFVAAIIWRLAVLCIVQNERYQTLANGYHFSSLTVTANRGTIFDRNDKILAQSSTVYKVYIDPWLFRESDLENKRKSEEEKQARSIRNRENPPYRAADINSFKNEVAEFSAQQLEISAESVHEDMARNIRYVVLKSQVEKRIADEIMQYMVDNRIGGIRIEQDSKRYYPKDELAAAVIGIVDGDGSGILGIESYYNEYLTGTDGRVISAKDANGNEMPYRYQRSFEAKSGNSVYLTLDSTLQYYVEKHLTDMVNFYGVTERACGIMMNVKTGEILAMATVPGFDLNEPRRLTNEAMAKQMELHYDHELYYKELYAQWRNKAIQETYTPGSVFKVVTAAAVLEEQLATFSSSFSCNGSLNVAGRDISCHRTSGHGTQGFKDALKNSCNPAFMEMGRRLGADIFFDYFKAFGLHEKTGIDLPGEVSSIYHDESMGPVELATCAFGQANAITPIEMVAAYAAVINGGRLMTPYVVDRVVDKDGNVVRKNTPAIRRQVISERASDMMRDSLEYVVNRNGDSNAYIKGYHIGGKSGTSQKIGQYTDNDMQYVASYGCFAPADNPEIVLLVLADEPRTGNYYGSVVAAPVARKILEEALPYLGYYPAYTQEELAALNITVPNVEGVHLDAAVTALINSGLKAVTVGNGPTVVAQVPRRQSSIPRGSTVILYTEQNLEEELAIVPNVVGMSLADANLTLTENYLNYTGAFTPNTRAVVQTQSHEPGRRVPKGTVIELQFVINEDSD